jgi:small ligand-binding sensory domain FIST
MARFGDGLGIGPDLSRAARHAAAMAFADVSGEPNLVFVFACSDDPDAVGPAVAEVRAALQAPDRATVLGCCVGGVVGDGRGVELEPSVSVWAASIPDATIRAFHLTAQREENAISIVGLPDPASDDQVAVLLADPYSFPIDGFVDRSREVLNGLPFVGGLAASSLGAQSARLVLDGEVYLDGAIGLLLGGTQRMAVGVSQGCRPIGPAMTVTGAERNVVFELAGTTATERLQEVLADVSPAERALAAAGLHLGIAMDEYSDRQEYGDFVVRAVLGADPDSGGLVVGDVVPVGRTVRFHVRDSTTAAEDLEQVMRRLKDRPNLGPIGGALLFTCNGRGAAFFGDANQDVQQVRKLLETDAVAGFFAAGEIGPVGGRTYVHGFTASVLAFGA